MEAQQDMIKSAVLESSKCGKITWVLELDLGEER